MCTVQTELPQSSKQDSTNPQTSNVCSSQTCPLKTSTLPESDRICEPHGESIQSIAKAFPSFPRVPDAEMHHEGPLLKVEVCNSCDSWGLVAGSYVIHLLKVTTGCWTRVRTTCSLAELQESCGDEQHLQRETDWRCCEGILLLCKRPRSPLRLI